ncbi:MAG: endonuclease III domain-containing protein [Methanobacteriaceae archaeon]|nr:endonuclease III domain-containing protein [Methanobacteriaceae archaeon]
MNFNLIYEKLLDEYSYQGWWPIISYEGSNPTKTGSIQGYHPGDYSFPRNSYDQFEIIIGSILTQNTSWPSVENALINLSNLDLFSSFNGFCPEFILDLAMNDEDAFKEAIRPSGYFNQKFNYLCNISKFYIELDGRTPSRSDLLSVKGVGNETADSIRLYGYCECEIIVDAYFKRILSYLGIIEDKYSYMKVKNLVESDFDGDFKDYQEFHGLIVEHGKRYYTKRPYGLNDKVLNEFKI